MFATGMTIGLAEWIIDDTCLVSVTHNQENLVIKQELFHTLNY